MHCVQCETPMKLCKWNKCKRCGQIVSSTLEGYHDHPNFVSLPVPMLIITTESYLQRKCFDPSKTLQCWVVLLPPVQSAQYFSRVHRINRINKKESCFCTSNGSWIKSYIVIQGDFLNLMHATLYIVHMIDALLPPFPVIVCLLRKLASLLVLLVCNRS